MKTLHFDYVIVGGGSAGCVVAARLAAESDSTVVLLERGRSDSNRWIHIPATFFKTLQSEDAEAVISEPDESLGGLPYVVPQGRVLGGGSSVNGMIYMRGQAQDYNDWADKHGCEGWCYDDVLPVFKRQEGNRVFNNNYHNSDGRLVVDAPADQHPVSARLIEAAEACGIPHTADFNGASQEGVGWYQVNASAGQRQSAAVCFLKPELGRRNLTLLTNHSVSRVRFKNRRAIAVETKDESGVDVLTYLRRERNRFNCGQFSKPKTVNAIRYWSRG